MTWGTSGVHLLVPTALGLAAAHSGGHGWPRAIAKRLALDGREHSGKLGRSGKHCCGVVIPSEGSLPRGTDHRATNLYPGDHRECAAGAHKKEVLMN
jgi:hypothetical protein